MNDPTENSAARQLARLCVAAPSVPAPSAVCVFAHPDDESVGAASLLPRLRLARFVYVTDGAPRDLTDAKRAGCATREDYAAMRRGELLSALDSIGVPETHIESVGLVDQEASLQLEALTRWVEILLTEHAPSVVLTHPYEGGHPDHDATAFAVHQAVHRLARNHGKAPVIIEATSYHREGSEWKFGAFLPDSVSHELVRRLSRDEQRLKKRLLGCYASQRAVLEQIPLVDERFRVAPAYDFTAPPHPGQLLYERYPWGISGTEWRQRASSALEHLEMMIGAAPRVPASSSGSLWA